MSEPTKPFAFAVTNGADFLEGVRPTLASAIELVRQKYSTPTAMIEVTACYADGSERKLQARQLATPDGGAWINAEEAERLSDTLSRVA